MREPRTKPDQDLLDKLKYGRLVDARTLDAAAKQKLADDPKLSQELLLNKALMLGRTEAPDMPESAAMVDAALQRAGQISLAHERILEMDATQEDSGIMRSLLAGRKWYWQAAAVLAVAVIVLGIAALWPWRVSVSPGGINVEQETAWAAVDGYVLEYTIEFDEYYSGTARDSADHPLWQVQVLLDDWAAEHSAADTFGGTRAKLEIERADMLFGEDHHYRYSLSIMVPTDDEALVDELTEGLSAIENLSVPQCYSQQWFYQEKCPDSHYIGRTIRINGTDYVYPQQIDTESLMLLKLLLGMSPQQEGQLLYALDDIAEFRQYNLGDIVFVSWDADGTVVIDSHPGELDFKSLGLPGWVHTINIFIPPGEIDLDYDPAELLANWARGGRSQVTSGGMMPRRLVVDLLPVEEWYGKDPATLATKIPAERIAALKELSGRLDTVVNGCKQRYPEAEEQMFLEPCGSAVPLQWQVRVYVEQPHYLLVELVNELRDAGAVSIRSFPDVPMHPDTLSLAVRPPQPVTLYYTLLEMADEHGHDVYLDVQRASPEQRAEAERLADLLQQVFDDWRDGQTGDSRPWPRNLRIRKVDDMGAYKNDDEVPVSATVEFTVDSELVDEFKQFTVAQGLPEPQVNRPESDLGLASQLELNDIDSDVVLIFTLPLAKLDERVPVAQHDTLYTPEEQRRSQELYQRMQSALDDWNKARAVERVSAELRKLEVDGAVVSICASTVWHDAETVLSLGEALEVDGAPCYQYGPAFLKRDKSYAKLMQHGEKQMVSGTVIGWSLLPLVRRAGISSGEEYVAEMQAEFTPGELDIARQQAELLRVVFDEFIKLHPELLERIFHYPGPVERSHRAYFSAHEHEGIISTAGVWLYLDDRERETELAAELITMVEQTGAVDVEAHTSHRSRYSYVAKE